MKNKILGCLVFLFTTTTAFAQSPYTQYGFGDLSDQSVGFNKGMGGVGIAFNKGNEVNPMNPASYASIDSMTMIFDGGLSGQITNFKEGDRKLNAKSGGFDYVVGSFRLIKNVGVTFGMMPFSDINYNYSSSTTMLNSELEMYSQFKGKGGLNQLFVGAGVRIFKPLTVGFNFSYLWGEMERSAATIGSSDINILYKEYNVSVNNYKLDFGVQYAQPLGKDMLTLGAVFSPGHKLGADPEGRIVSTNSSLSKSDSTSYTIANGLSLPTTIGVGLGYNHDQKLRVGADFRLQKWGSVDYPAFSDNRYILQSGLLKDSYKLNVGAEWIPNPRSTRSVFHHIRYRVGAGYTTPYYYINGQDGPKDLQLSLGVGVPIMNAYNNRSILNISAQWQHRSADNLITENTFRLNIGITFNERWFSKMKVE